MITFLKFDLLLFVRMFRKLHIFNPNFFIDISYVYPACWSAECKLTSQYYTGDLYKVILRRMRGRTFLFSKLVELSLKISSDTACIIIRGVSARTS